MTKVWDDCKEMQLEMSAQFLIFCLFHRKILHRMFFLNKKLIRVNFSIKLQLNTVQSNSFGERVAYLHIYYKLVLFPAGKDV